MDRKAHRSATAFERKNDCTISVCAVFFFSAFFYQYISLEMVYHYFAPCPKEKQVQSDNLHIHFLSTKKNLNIKLPKAVAPVLYDLWLIPFLWENNFTFHGELFILKLLDNVYKHVGFTEKLTDSQLTIFTRIEVLTWACDFGNEDCVMNAMQQFNYWRNTSNPDINNPISPNLRSIVYCTAIRVGGQSEWEFAWQRYLGTNVESEKDLLLQALACTREIWLLNRLLDWVVMENSGMKKQDAIQVFVSVANNIAGQPLTFNYFRNNWLHLNEYFGTSLSIVNSIVTAATKRIHTRYELKNLIEFAKVHLDELGTATRTMQQAVERVESNIRWIDNNHATIHNWLRISQNSKGHFCLSQSLLSSHNQCQES